MNNQGTHANVLCGLLCAQNGVAQQATAKLSPLHTDINSQSAEDDDRDGIWHIAPHFGVERFVADFSGAKCVVASDVAMFVQADEDTTDVVVLVGKGALFEPVVQRRDAAVKGIAMMAFVQRHGWGQFYDIHGNPLGVSSRVSASFAGGWARMSSTR